MYDFSNKYSRYLKVAISLRQIVVCAWFGFAKPGSLRSQRFSRLGPRGRWWLHLSIGALTTHAAIGGLCKLPFESVDGLPTDYATCQRAAADRRQEEAWLRTAWKYWSPTCLSIN